MLNNVRTYVNILLGVGKTALLLGCSPPTSPVLEQKVLEIIASNDTLVHSFLYDVAFGVHP